MLKCTYALSFFFADPVSWGCDVQDQISTVSKQSFVFSFQFILTALYQKRKLDIKFFTCFISFSYIKCSLIYLTPQLPTEVNSSLIPILKNKKPKTKKDNYFKRSSYQALPTQKKIHLNSISYLIPAQQRKSVCGTFHDSTFCAQMSLHFSNVSFQAVGLSQQYWPRLSGFCTKKDILKQAVLVEFITWGKYPG